MLQHSGLRFLLPYMRPYHGRLLIGTVYALIGAAATAFTPYVLGRAIDDVLVGVRLDVLALYSVAIIVLAIILAIFRYALRMLTGDIAAGVSYRMSQDLFDRLLVLDRGTLMQYGTGDLLSRASSDFIYIWRFYSAGFQMSIHAILLLLIGCALMAVTSPSLAAVVVVMLLISLGVQLKLGRVLEHSFDRVQQQMGRISAFAQEHLNAIRMVAAYAQEHATGLAFRRLNDDYANQNLHFVLRSSIISPLPALVVRLAAAVIILVGGTMIIAGQLTVGIYVQFIVYLGVLSGAANSLSQAFERLQQGSAAAGRIGAVLRRAPQIADAPDAVAPRGPGALRFENVGVRIDDRWILRHLDVEVPAGTTLGIVGATGAGKSTLLSLVGRVRDADEGRVLLDGVDVRQVRLADLRRMVISVPQDTLLFSMIIRDNIALGVPHTPDERVFIAAQGARLTNDLAQLPHGLATLVGERGATLSGGQKQRTAIARALVRDPQVLLLDDTLSSVDTQTAAEILRELRTARQQRTCLIVSQRIASVRDAEQIIVIEDGHVVEQGHHQTLLALGGRYAAMYRRELQQAEEQLADEEQAHEAH